MSTATESRLEVSVKEWVAQGMSDAEIAQKVFEVEEAKSLTPEQVVELVIKAKQSQEVQQKLVEFQKAQKAKENEAKAKTEAEAQVKKIVDEKLKSIEINLNKHAMAPITTRFDYSVGKYVEVKSHEADAYKHFNQMLYCLASKDEASAKSISNEIDQDNDKRLQQLGIKSDGVVSDVGNRGGFAFPITVDEMIMQMTYTLSAIWSLTDKYVVNYNSHVVPTMGNFTVQWLSDQDDTITENDPVFSNPTIDLKRCAIATSISRLAIEQRGMDMVNKLVQGMASAFARNLDLMITSGAVTGNSDLFNGLVFDASTVRPTAYALSTLTDAKIEALINTLSDEADTTVRLIANRKIIGEIGKLEYGDGKRIFEEYATRGASFTPFGVPIVKCNKIPSTFDVGAGKRTTGTDDVLICADLSKVGTTVSESTRIETSTDVKFYQDKLAIKAIKKYGQKVLSGSSTLGVVCVAQELTN